MPGAVKAPHRLRRIGSSAAEAIAFLTVVPVRARSSAASPVGDAATVWFPVVGALVGGLAGAVRIGGQDLVGALPATVLAVGVLVAVTGALHQDGLADVADALGARGGRDRRLAVMRDPVNGTFGTLALIGWVLIVVSTIAALPGSRALRALVAACALGRSAALVHARLLPPARADGLGAGFEPGPVAVVVASLAAVAVALPCGLERAGLAVAATAVTMLVTTLASERLFGGRSGDTLGATVAVTEVAVCLVLLAGWR